MTSVEVYNLDDDDLKEPLQSFAKGDHVIGRGELKCNDKRVSRRHAIISVTDDSAKLKPIHTNPCFYKSSSGKSIETVAQDTTKELHDWDMFALLADKFWFRVRLVSANDRGDAELRLSKRTQNDDQETSPNKRARIEPTSNTLDRSVDEEKFVENIQNVNEDHQNALDHYTNDSNESVDLLNPMQTSENDYNSGTNTTNNAETQNNEQDQIPVEKGPNSEDGAASNICQHTEDFALKETDMEPVSIKAEPQEEEDVVLKTEPPEGFSVTVKKEPKIEPSENNPSAASSSNGASSSGTSDKPKTDRRDRCWYGASCYRRNPIHRQGFSHPGDPDYDSDPDDDRPPCPFGNGCYRTNMDHRRQYKHSAKPAPKPSSSVQKKARKRNMVQSSTCQDNGTDTESDDGSQPTKKTQRGRRNTTKKIKFNETPEDDYDLEDPFIDDASSDAYEPSDDGDDSDWDDDVECADETEDVKRLVKEAKRFTEKRAGKTTKGDQKLEEISSEGED